jgi:hypothetical protein
MVNAPGAAAAMAHESFQRRMGCRLPKAAGDALFKASQRMRNDDYPKLRQTQ